MFVHIYANSLINLDSLDGMYTTRKTQFEDDKQIMVFMINGNELMYDYDQEVYDHIEKQALEYNKSKNIIKDLA